jgi:Ala-tRNA(Pro) deacylase
MYPEKMLPQDADRINSNYKLFFTPHATLARIEPQAPERWAVLAGHCGSSIETLDRGPQPSGSRRPMPLTKDELLAHLAALGIATTTIEHPAVFTVTESDALEKQLSGGHTKNLFLKDAKDRLFLVVAESHAVVDLKTLHTRIGAARLSFGKPDLLMEVLGIPPGSVTAFSLANDRGKRVNVVVDAALMQYDTINCHPLVNTATTNIRRDDLLRFMRACGHEPQITALS